MHEPLPVIRYADYSDVKPPVLPPSDNVSEVPRARHDSDTESTLDTSRFRIIELYLRRWEGTTALQTQSHLYPTHRNHADIPPNGAHRVRFIPVGRTGGAAAEICFRIEYPERVQGGRLELFIRNEANRIWHQDLTAHELTASPGLGGVPNSVWSAWNWDGSLPAIDNGHDAKFPDNRVTAQFAPYKLKLTIWGANPDRVTEKTQAWTYVDVPFDSKYKMVRFVPSTEFGCFEVDWDPAAGHLEYITRLAFGFSVAPAPGAPPPAWNNVRKDGRRDDIRNRIPVEWADRQAFDVQGANGDRLSLIPAISVEEAHRGDVTNPPMGQTMLEVGANAGFVNAARTAGAHFFVHMLSGVGGSGVIPAANEAILNLYDPSAFEERDTGTQRILTGNNSADMKRVRDTVVQFLATSTLPHRVLQQDVFGTMMDAPIITIDYPADAVVPRPDPFPELQRLCNALNGVTIATEQRVLIKGITGRGDKRHRGHPPRGEERSTMVANFLSGYLRPAAGGVPPVTAANIAAAARVVVQELPAGNERRGQPRIEIEFGCWHDEGDATIGPVLMRHVPYNAMVHEFGHVFGYPDEYQFYGGPGGTAPSLADSQPRSIDLSDIYGVDAPVFPQPGRMNITSDLMSSGTIWHSRYYITLAEGLQCLIGIPSDRRLPRIGIVDKPHGVAAAAAVGAPFHTLFTNRHLQDAVKAGEAAIRGGQRDPAQVITAVQGQINPNLGTAELRYTRVAERDSMVDTTRIRSRKLVVAAGVADGDNMLHCAAVAAPPALPWLEVFPGYERFGEDEQRMATQAHDAPGCFVHLQTATNHRDQQASHVKMLVRRAPRGTEQPWLRTRSQNVTLHRSAAHNAPAVGNAIVVNGVNCVEIQVANADFGTDQSAEFWIRGAVVSGAAGDTGVDLLLNNNNPPNPGDIIDDLTITVVDVTLRARVPVTPARSARPIRRAVIPNGPPGAQMAVANVGQPLTQPNAAPQEYDLLALVQNNRVAAAGPLTVRTFEDNPPLVLVRGSLPGGSPVEAEVTVAPAAVQNAIHWDVARASDDAVAGAAPTLSAGGAAHQHRVALDQSGSFHLHARYQGESVAVLNLVIVEAVLANAGDDGTKAGIGTPEIGNVSQDGYKLGAAPMALRDIVSFHTAPTRQNCMQLYAEVRLLGGGPDRRRGVNQVYAAWIQNKADNDVWGEYTDTVGAGPARRVTMIYAENKDQATLVRPAADYYFRPGENPTPLGVALGPGHPILDTSRQGESGLDCALSGARTERVDEAQGSLLKVSSGDGPGTEFYVDHPCHANYRLSTVRYRHGFCSYLCLWTNVVGNGDSPARAEAGVADQRFAVIRRVDWEVDGQWTVRWPNAGHGGHGAPVVEGRYRTRIVNRYPAVNAVMPAENTDLEPYYPTALNVFAWDAR